MRKRTIAWWILLPILFITVLLAFILSPFGAPMIRLIANNTVSGLSIDNIDGTILSDFTVEGVSWQNESWQLTTDKATVNLVLGCLLANKVCVDKLHTKGIHLTQLSVTEDDEPTPPAQEPFSLPIAVKLNDISIEQTQVNLPGQQISLQSLRLNGHADKKVILNEVTFNGLEVELEPAKQNTAPAQPASYALSYTAPQLPEIATPIALVINDFSFTDIALTQGDTRQTVNLITFEQLQFSQANLQLTKLHVEHPQGQLNLTSEATLKANYPLALTGNAALTVQQGISERITMQADGALDDLTVSINATGAYQASLKLTANLLDDSLPLQLTASWPQQALPGLPDGKLFKGQLSARGTMGAYQVKANSAAAIPSIGQVPVTLDIQLNKNNISVNQLNAKLLDGEISNTGTLYLNDTVSWSGTTNVKEISTTSLSPQGPTGLHGQFTSLMQLTPKGVEASISNLTLNGQQDTAAFSLSGSAVYSQANELVVSSLRLEQGENYADVAGQMLKNRYLKGTVKLNLPALETLYPAVSGAVTADIDVAGEWQDPAANGTIALTDVVVSPQLNPSAAAQGNINGEINLTGALSNHHFETRISSADYSLLLDLSGSWADERWKGQISQSELGIFATRWALEAPFTVAVRPAPFSTKVTQNCWQSRNEGSLCLQDLLYQDDVARWDLSATQLPIGLWASEAAGNLLPQPADATLSINSQGKMPKGGEPEGDFALTVTPATWRLGTEGQVPINIDEVMVKGALHDSQLTAVADFHSQQLGDLQVDIATRPFAANPELNGNLRVKGIKVSPLKPISPAIRELTGQINGDLAISGPLATPKVQGELALTDGNIDIDDTPARISDWTQTLQFNGSDVTFDGTFAVGGGQGALDGQVDYSDPAAPQIKVNLTGESLEVQQRDIVVRVSPDIKASVKPGEVIVTGQVAVPWARVKIEELPESAVAPSKDVHLRGEPPSEDPLDMVNAKINVIIDEARAGQVQLEAFGLTANLAGELQVSTQPAPLGYGSLQLTEGRFQAYGQDLIIQTGEIQFNGPLDQPLLMVEAIRDPDKTDDGLIAGIRVDGPADSPNISVFSTPSMDQATALSYLLTGSGSTGGGGNTDYAAILLGMGLSNTNKIQGELGKAIGIDDFAIGTTSGSAGNDPKLSLSGRLNDRLTVQYNFDVGLGNSDSTSETVRRRSAPPDLAMRYQWLPQFYIEAIQTTIEEQTEFALDFYYQFFLGEAADSKQPKALQNSPPSD